MIRIAEKKIKTEMGICDIIIVLNRKEGNSFEKNTFINFGNPDDFFNSCICRG